MYRLSLIILMATLSVPALACSFAATTKAFTPSPATFQSKLNTRDRFALLPPPRVELLSIKRGTAAPGSSCDDAGVITIKVSWPTTSIYPLKNIGFYFRVASGQAPDYVFPLTPVTGTRIKNGATEVSFIWLDGSPEQHKMINFVLEVFAVNRGLEIGPSATIEIKS